MQFLRLHTPIAGDMGLIPGQGRDISHASQYGQKKREREIYSCTYQHCSALCGCSVVHLCLTLCDPMDRSPPGSSVRGILQARILGWVTFPAPGHLPNPGTETASPESPALAGGFFTNCTIWEAPSATALLQ